jgi:ribosomal protein S18 acetylase RimI-like enzyme
MMALREARREDVPAIMRLLVQDQISEEHDDPQSDMSPYQAAFDAIAADPNNSLHVWEQDGVVVGCMQMTFVPGMLLKGGLLAQVEGVRVDRTMRGRKIGEQMMAGAVAMAHARGCVRLQLTTNKNRHDAHRFYKRLGFVASHEGMKLKL